LKLAGIQEAQKIMEQWKADGRDKEGQGGNGLNLYLNEGDMVYFHSIWSGKDGDPYCEVYFIHESPPPPGQRFGKRIFCPVESGFDVNYACQGCAQGWKLKKRFRVWLYVSTIMRKTLREGQQLPLVNHNGRQLYQDDIGKPMLWDVSAWRDGPWNNFVSTFNATGDLHVTGMYINVTGKELEKRTPVSVLPGSQAFPTDLLEQVRPECTPIRELLFAELAKPATASVPPAGQSLFASANISAPPFDGGAVLAPGIFVGNTASEATASGRAGNLPPVLPPSSLPLASPAALDEPAPATVAPVKRGSGLF
jgi:hypothetical protein